MKRYISLLLSLLMVIGMGTVTFAQTSYEQPFASGTMGSKTYRIPAIYTLNDGSVIAAADMRYDHGSDSPNNIDTLVAISEDGYLSWNYNIVNKFDDYADNLTNKYSASFIDTAIVQSKTTDRIFMITDAWTSFGGYQTAKKGTGFTTINGESYILLTTGSVNDDIDTFDYYIGKIDNGFAPVIKLSDNSVTEYTVDAEYNLYKNGNAVYMNQVGSDEQVQQNVFYDDAVFSVYNTCYLWMRYSDDNGLTWSSPVILSSSVKSSKESFLGIAPGRGFVTEYNGKERIIFCVYDNAGGIESVSTIYSDDNGATWHRGEATSCRLATGKTSESQIVSLPDGTLRMYARNAFSFVTYADSSDGGVSWSTFKSDMNLPSNGNCMVSFINYSKKINGKNVILASYSSNQNERADGVVRVGLVNNDNSVDWVDEYHVNDGFFAYSCLTELSDGNIGYLYEDDAAKISYAVLSISSDGKVSEINGNNASFEADSNVWHKIVDFLRAILVKLLVRFELV